MVDSISLFSGFSSVSTVPAGRAAKASLVGARTVKGPAPDRVSTRPAALTAATSVVWSAELTAFSMMFLSANMAAPPTIGLSWADTPAMAETESRAPRERARRFEEMCIGNFLPLILVRPLSAKGQPELRQGARKRLSQNGSG